MVFSRRDMLKLTLLGVAHPLLPMRSPHQGPLMRSSFWYFSEEDMTPPTS